MTTQGGSELSKLYIVGSGPGSADYVTPAARKAVREAQVVVGAQRSLALFKEDIHGETVTLTAKNVDQALTYAAQSAKNGKVAAVLSTGDPGFSGLLGSLLSRNLTTGIDIVVVPAVGAIQACAARLGLEWADAVLFAFHSGTNPQKKAALVQAVKAGYTVMLLPDPKTFPPQTIAAFLTVEGIPKTAKVAVCENLTLDNEKITNCTLEEAAQREFSSMCVMVIN
jgi:cobalt-precorrin-7 (C5)-methyltransferase